MMSVFLRKSTFQQPTEFVFVCSFCSSVNELPLSGLDLLYKLPPVRKGNGSNLLPIQQSTRP